MKIVIVEDEIRIREGLSRLIKKISPKYSVVGEASDGLEGIRIIKALRPDLVITDVRMPGIDGLEMLYQLHEMDIAPCAIILSAYSEFTYAKQAINLGVSEYLLKPISVVDLTCSLKKIESELAQSPEKSQQGQRRTLDELLLSLLQGNIDQESDALLQLRQNYGIGEGLYYAIVQVRVFPVGEFDRDRILQVLSSVLHSQSFFECCILVDRNKRTVAIFLQIKKDKNVVMQWFEKDFFQLAKRYGLGAVFTSWSESLAISKFREVYIRGETLLEWNLALNGASLITESLVEHAYLTPLLYPLVLEEKARSAFCSRDQDALTLAIESFLEIIRKSGQHTPSDLKNAIVRFFWTVLTMAREIDYERYESLPQQTVMNNILFAVSWSEIEAAMSSLVDLVSGSDNGKRENDNVLITRVKALVQEFYGQGINLEEIAAKIDVTPEYLSVQFKTCTGTNFSAYIKDFRIRKAKELLLGSDLKISTIGEKVGYRDSKYFCRVFKEITGQIPVDYRRSHR